MVRSMRLYRTWSETILYLDKAACAFLRSDTEKLLTPMNRTLPRSTNSSMAAMVSPGSKPDLGQTDFRAGEVFEIQDRVPSRETCLETRAYFSSTEAGRVFLWLNRCTL